MAVFGKILIPYDGSESSKRAARKGIEIAQDEGAEVVGVKVIAFIGELIAPSDRMWEVIEENLHKKAEAVLDEFEVMAEKSGVNCTTEVREGPPDHEVLSCAEEKGADLIVMGADGKGAMGSYLGKSIDRLVRKSPCPVMVVH